jgi:hypothetical protein
MKLISLVVLSVCIEAAAAPVSIVTPHNPGSLGKLAASEVQRYVYLRTGNLLPIGGGTPELNVILLTNDLSLASEQYRIQVADSIVTIAGGSELGLLYGAYAYAERLGVRFYLHADVVPDERLREWPAVNEMGKPLFRLRGVNPWGSHPFGCDAWSADDYKAVFTQLTKMRLNFLGLHCYPEGHPYAEPTVWHGLAGDFEATGRVQRSYASRYFNTLLTTAWGDYLPSKTSDYRFGGARLFERDDWAPPVLQGHCPLPATPDDCNDVFNRMAAQFRDAFTFARQLGIRTCLGTEAPLILPQAVAQRTRDAHAVYEGTFRRLMASHPLDYYWLWTPEGWTWEGNKPAQYSNTVADIRLAIEALRSVKAPFQLATAGWVLGPAHDRAAFDLDLPKNIPMSAINRNTGATEVDPAFGRIAGREKWAIPWLESDNRNGLAALQLEAGRMRRDAADALACGCTGLMGLHWRTEILSPNISALAQAAWNQSWNTPPRWSVPGQIASYSNAAIAGTPDAPLYRTCRYDLGTIRLQAPDGRYKVTLKFCEPHFKSAGERLCDVRVQSRTVLTNLDIFARVGQFAALDFTFDAVVVTNGLLTVELIPRKSLPCISAIAVESPAFTSRINCGGPAYQDWQADAGRPRSLPCDDFYADWARANFGREEVGRVFAAIDGKVPQVTDGGCPSGRLTPVATPWGSLRPQFAFVDDLERCRPVVQGRGNLDRFDYWLNTFKYHRSLAQLRCALAKPDAEELARLYSDAYRHLLGTVNTPGAVAMVVNMESHPGWGAYVARNASQPWPKEYQGEPRTIVPTVRSVVARNENIEVTVIALDNEPMQMAALHWRPLGRGAWRSEELRHVTRAVYRGGLPTSAGSLEYYIQARTTGEKTLIWPATAPQLNQTVVAME